MLTSIFALALLGQCAGGSCALPARAYPPAAPYQPLAPPIYQGVPAYRPFYAPAPAYSRPRGAALGRLFRR